MLKGRQAFDEHLEVPAAIDNRRRRLQEKKSGLKQRQQSISKGGWSLSLILKAKDDKSLLHPRALKAAKRLADIFNKNKKFRDEFCLKNVEVRSKKEDECGKVLQNAAFACRGPVSALDMYYPAQVNNEIYKIFGQGE